MSMSLFPAYSGEEQPRLDSSEGEGDHDDEGWNLSPGSERALLEERPPPAAAPIAPPPAPACDFFVDRRLDRGNLRVSTLYYPARPEYRAVCRALGAGGGRRTRVERGKRRRYWSRAVPPGGAAVPPDDAAARAAALRRRLDAEPDDEDLWLHYIDFLEWCGETVAGETAAEAARRGAGALPRSWRLRAHLHSVLPPRDLVHALRELREHEEDGCVRAELWAREVSACACNGDLEAAREAAGAALRDRRAAPLHHLPLYAYGAALRSGGLWERLVQLIELVAAMNFPSSAAFPAARCAAREAEAERQLAEFEAAAARSGLPRGAVWARVERARGALHWRAAAGGDALELAADPQRAPPPAADAALLAPAADARAAFRLLVTLLRLSEAPLLPRSAAAARGAAGGAGAALLAADWEAASGGALLALLRAARRLPPAHPARAALSPRAARRLLADTPLRPVWLDDTTGFEAWSSALWEAALQWAGEAGGERRAALLGWRLRLLHARLLLRADDEEAVRRLRGEARELLRRHAGAAAAPYAVFARLEAAAAGAARGLRAALGAARAAGAAEHALFAARVAAEVAPGAAPARWALVCAALGRPLPPDAAVLDAPPPDLVAAAARRCEERCAELERQHEAEGPGAEEEPEAALLPGAAEWAAARVRLAEPRARAALFERLRVIASGAGGEARAAALRYREAEACALVAAAAAEHGAGRAARALLPLAPLNAFLALAGADGAAGGAARPAGGECGELARLLPALLRAAAGDWPPHECRAAERAAARARRGAAGGALALALRLEAAARAPGPPAPAHAALLRALHHAPHYKWVYVRGAALGAAPGGAGGEELPELLLERGLRLRALPDELLPPPSAEPAPSGGTDARPAPAASTL